MLTVRNLITAYGPITVLKNVSIHVEAGEIVCLIGANGAGKTTLLNTISGLVHPVSGNISFDGSDIQRLSSASIVSRGIVQVPEGRQIFAQFSVLENLELGAYQRLRQHGKSGIRQDMDEVFALFPRLDERRNQIAGTMSGGEQQMLAIGRAIMARPRLLLLDEPSLGLAPKLVDVILKTITRLNREGMTVLLVEQNARKALEISDRGYVMETGKIILQGSARDLIEDRDVQRAYLGMDYQSPSDR